MTSSSIPSLSNDVRASGRRILRKPPYIRVLLLAFGDRGSQNISYFDGVVSFDFKRVYVITIVVSKEDIADCPDLIDDYLRDKKQLWGLTHDIKIYGHDVELYAQDRRDPIPSGQGVFSLTNSFWIRRPTYEQVDLSDQNIVRKVRHYMEKIDFLIDNKADDRDSFEKLKEKLREMRASAIQRGGEFAVENLVFKELRNRGYLDKLSDHLRNLKVTSLSID